MKNIIRFCLLLVLSNNSITSIAQQNSSGSNTTYPTSFAFTNAVGDPLGYEWDNEHRKYKYDGENIESDFIGWRTKKSHIGIGGFFWESYKYGDTTCNEFSINLYRKYDYR